LSRSACTGCGFSLLAAKSNHHITVSTRGALGGNNRPGAVLTLGKGRGVAVYSPAEIKEFIAAVAKREAGAFEKLYGATSAKIYGVVLRILRRHDLAAGVVEDAYLQIWQTAGEFDQALGSPISWMVAIARRRAIDLARKPDGGASDTEPEIADAESPGALPRREMTEELKRLLTCIGRLEPERQRMVLLAYYGAFSREQLAQKLDTPANLLKGSLRRSLFEIEQCLTS
jgi:RNA polymerase sigma-70 factor (ECF subfamily)